MNLIVRNQATVSPSYDAPANGCSKIVLGDGQSVDYPINVTLGSEQLSTDMPRETEGHANVTFSASANNAFNLAVSGSTNSAVNPRVQHATSTDSLSGKILLSFNALINSGVCLIRFIDIYGTQISTNHTVVLGGNEIILESTNSSYVNKWYFNGTQDFDVEITEWSIKEITTPNSYAYYCKSD